MRIFTHAVMVALLAVAPASTEGTALNQITFVEWVDPTEHAFRVEVPKDWQVSGGLHWNGQVDARCFVRARSSDGKIQIFLDDPDILPRTILNPVYTRMGWVEGRVVQSQTGPIFIQRFLSGSQYAQQHVTWRLCRNPRWVKVGDVPSLSKSITTALEPLARSSGGMARASAGEASFTCNDAQGYVFATTVLISSMSGPIQGWGVYKLCGFLSSDPMRSMVARYIMEHMTATLTIDRS